MKKYILTIAFLATLGSYAQQLQNANWCFGNNAGLNFNGIATPTSIGSSLNTLEGCATYSDTDGNLVFYTGGVDIYKADGTLMANGQGLYGNSSSTQSATIIPRPGHTSVYVFTIDGETGNKRGLHFTEVDVLGGGSIVGTINTPLKDENGINITTNYKSTGNMSEKATSTTHCDGTNYWFVAHIGQRIYSYLVTYDGVSLTPTAVSTAPVNLQTLTKAGAGQMKISRDGTRLALACRNLTSSVFSDQDGAIYIGNFDQSSGQVLFNTTVLYDDTNAIDNYYGLEFSPDSNILYFGLGNEVYQCAAKNPSNPNPTLVIPTQTDSLIILHYQFQIAIDGKIYIASMRDLNTDGLSVINNPDNAANPDVEESAITFSSGQGEARLGLPAWVHQQVTPCPPHLNFDSPDPNFLSYTHRAGSSITTETNYTVVAGQEIAMRAGNYILMSPNTLIDTGSIFTAQIAQCVTCRSISGVSQRSGELSDDENEKGLQLYPNPSSDYVSLNIAGDTITGITVTSLEGKTVFKASNTTSDFTLDVTGYSRGMYIVTIATLEGNTFTKKLLVK